MDAYLLSGWRVWVPDENGNPLYRGRVCFYDASTSEPAQVYSDKSKVTSLGTVVAIDGHGFLPAVWLDASHLYKCVVERKIQEDPETWVVLWEVNDVGNPFLTSDEVESKKTAVVNTISDLRAVDPSSSDLPDYMYVMGWFEPGDTGSPMLFEWNSTSTASEDGHWIVPSSTPATGRWEQILDDELDPRKFGAIPDTGNDVSSNIINCMLYASEPHVQDISDPTVYKPRTVKFVKSGTYHTTNLIDFSLYKMISAFGSVPVPVVICDGVYFDFSVQFGEGVRIESSQKIGSNFIIKWKETYLRTSWFGNKGNIMACSPRIVVIDDDVSSSGLYLTGRIVINLMDSMPSSYSLSDCVVIDAKSGKVTPESLALGAYVFSHGTNSLSLDKTGGSNVFIIDDDGFIEFFNMIELSNGFRIDNDNFMGEFDDGYNFKHWGMKGHAKIDLTAINGNTSDILFDLLKVSNQADIRRLNTDTLYPMFNRSISLNGGLYRSYSERTVTWTSYGSHTIDSTWTEGKLNIVMEWAWYDSSSVAISDVLYMGKPTAVQKGDIICIENCGPKAPGYVFPNLYRNGDIETFTKKCGPIYCVENNGTALIDVIAPFTRKHFRWSGTAWEPCDI